MSASTNRQWILASRPTAMVGPEHFTLRQAAVPEPAAGEVLVRQHVISVDPANRAWMMPMPTYKAPVNPGDVMHGFALGEVLRSNDPGFKPGDLVEGMMGWQEYAAMPARELTRRNPAYSHEMLLSLLGITGLTAYYGLLDVGTPKAGETVVVSAAAGAVGSIVGQIARIKGCRVVGTAGGADKCQWLKQELGFDEALDYRSGDMRKALAQACPKGIDVYFDNTGGDVLQAALLSMRVKGRIVCCGAVSQYNAGQPAPGPVGVPALLVTKRLRMEGFIVMDFFATRDKAEAELHQWYREGKIKSPVEVVKGFENTPAAMIRLFQGDHRGKLLVDVR
ncbi:MAG: NADP-dependent oxidoreductase [Nevskia sp.]|nr:NADP-dependent oxidoreductase [Nevskia sp.]